MGNVVSDAIGGIEHAFKKAASVVTFGLIDDPDEAGGGGDGSVMPSVRLEGVAGLNYDNKLLDKPDVTPDDSTMFLAQNYQEESDHLRRSNPVVKPKIVEKEITPETLLIAGGILTAAVLLSE